MFFLLLKKIFINTGTGGFHGERSRRIFISISLLVINDTGHVNYVSSGCMKGSRKDKSCRILLSEKGLTFLVTAGLSWQLHLLVEITHGRGNAIIYGKMTDTQKQVSSLFRSYWIPAIYLLEEMTISAC